MNDKTPVSAKSRRVSRQREKTPATGTVTKRQILQAQRKRRRIFKNVLLGGAGIITLALVGILLWSVFRPAAGEAVAVMPDVSHVPEGTDPGPYNSNPPTSGRHFANPMPAGFYQEADLEMMPPFPEGYLVHSLEHGHVIFWYNCNLLSEEACLELKDQIQSVMDEFNGVKVTAFPWDSIEHPVVMTSWGRIQRFETFDPREASYFVRTNRNRAPEPQAP